MNGNYLSLSTILVNCIVIAFVCFIIGFIVERTIRVNKKAWCRGSFDADGISLNRQMNASHGRLISEW